MKRLVLMAALLASTAHAQSGDDLHQRLLTLDTHLDTPINFARPGWDFSQRHSHGDDIAQVDLARMKDGALDGGFFVIYTDQGPLTAEGYADALAFARARSDLIDATIKRHRRLIRPALDADDARRLNAKGKLIAFKAMENSYALGGDLGLLGEFYRRGVRLAGPVHGKNNQFADSATDDPQWGGLSPLGRQWVAEMNRQGMVIDASHASDAAFDQMLELSSAPILLSHSSLRSTFDHPRNLDEDRLRKLAAKGGALCISTIFMSPMNMTAERARLFAAYENAGALSPAEQADLVRQWRELDQTEPMWEADFEAYMQMVLRAIEVAGADHICFGADWDGGGGLAGLEDISALPKVTERLKAAGYSEADLEKMWSGNVLRILDRAQKNRAPR
jgi:membrane dipeptidase